MKNTGERLMWFVKQRRRNALIYVFLYTILALVAAYVIAGILIETRDEDYFWIRVVGGGLGVLLFCFLAYGQYVEYNDLGEDAQKPALITKRLKLLDRFYMPPSEGDGDYFEFDFEENVTARIYQSFHRKELNVGQVYQLRILAESGFIFDIKTVDGELIDNDVETV